MKITLRLFAILRKCAPPGMEEGGVLELEDGATVQHVLDMLKTDKKLIKIVLRNARRADPGEVIQDGDVLAVFPPVAGG